MWYEILNEKMCRVYFLEGSLYLFGYLMVIRIGYLIGNCSCFSKGKGVRFNE